jgi:hypothetical protein
MRAAADGGLGNGFKRVGPRLRHNARQPLGSIRPRHRALSLRVEQAVSAERCGENGHRERYAKKLVDSSGIPRPVITRGTKLQR